MDTPDDGAVRVEKAGAVTTVILHRPEVRNAVDPATARRLLAAFQEFEKDSEAHIAVLYGAGGTFCAGFDLKALTAGAVPAGMAEYGDGPMGPTRLRLSKPVIAAVAGHAVAGGLELALWCDLRVVEESAVFGVFCRRWGVPLADGGTVRLPRLIGRSRALDMILTGRAVGAEEALSWGLANRVVADGTAREAAEALAAQVAALPQLCLREDRLSALEQGGLAEEAALRNELRHAQVSMAEAVGGARRFADGAGRHGVAAS
ncbi:MAG: crotonase/enoyl-CoA hydratase family protein [Catenulispora sp.]